MSYKIITDATSDLPLALAQQWGVEVLPMDYTLDGQPHTYAPGNSDLPLPEIFNAMRNGAVAVTSQINAFSFTKPLSPISNRGWISFISLFLRPIRHRGFRGHRQRRTAGKISRPEDRRGG